MHERGHREKNEVIKKCRRREEKAGRDRREGEYAFTSSLSDENISMMACTYVCDQVALFQLEKAFKCY